MFFLVVVVVVVAFSLMWGRDEGRTTTTRPPRPAIPGSSNFASNAEMLRDFVTCAGGMLHAAATPDILPTNMLGWKWQGSGLKYDDWVYYRNVAQEILVYLF